MAAAKPRLLVTEPENYAPAALDILSESFEVLFGPLQRDNLLAKASDVEGLLVRLAHRIDAEVFGRASGLRVIGSPTTGLNHIDLAAAAERNIAVISLRGERDFLEGIHATAEHSWALLLALLRRIPAASASVAAGHWKRDLFRGRELHGKTIGIVGYGRLGSKVASYARSFGMAVLAADPVAKPADWIDHVDLAKLASQSDVISLHLSHEADAAPVIDAAFLAQVKPGALLINTARGEVVDETALVEALESGRLGGAALDVLCDENAAGAPGSAALKAYARQYENLIITPHIGGATEESMRATEVFIAEKLRDFARKHLAGEPG